MTNTTTIVARASSALGKIDKYGPRGVTMVSHQEVEAMALLLALFGLPPVRPEEACDPIRFTDFMTRLVETHTGPADPLPGSHQ